jgi:hypothetical protein
MDAALPPSQRPRLEVFFPRRLLGGVVMLVVVLVVSVTMVVVVPIVRTLTGSRGPSGEAAGRCEADGHWRSCRLVRGGE